MHRFELGLLVLEVLSPENIILVLLQQTKMLSAMQL